MAVQVMASEDPGIRHLSKGEVGSRGQARVKGPSQRSEAKAKAREVVRGQKTEQGRYYLEQGLE